MKIYIPLLIQLILRTKKSYIGCILISVRDSNIEAIREKDKIAEKLFEKSLFYYPNLRAYLGLGILSQKKRSYEESIEILSQGIESFPDSEELSICLGISYMNLNDYNSALSCFLKFPDSKDANPHIARCYKELGDYEKESLFIEISSNQDEEYL